MAPSLFYVLFASLFAFVCAQNLPPPIIVPKTGDVWKAGEIQTVKWSIDGINIYDPSLNPLRGKIFIGHLTNDTGERYIWYTQPLASNFTYLQTQVDVIVPTFPTAHNYFLVLVGQSDNWSQFFTIENPADPSGTGTLGTSVTIATLSQTASSVSASASSTTSATSVSASATDPATSASASSSSSAGSTSASATAPPSSTSASTTASSSSSATSATSSATILSAPSSSSTAPPSGGSNGAAANVLSVGFAAVAAVVLSSTFLLA